MDTAPDYESDFVGWTERQAAIIKGLTDAPGLDTDNLAEEIEDLGRSEIRAASSLLRQVLTHLIKLAAEPEAPSRDHWLTEVLAFQADAVQAATGGVRQRVDLDKVWRLASNEAIRSLRVQGRELTGLSAECPFSLDDLLAEDFDPLTSANRIPL